MHRVDNAFLSASSHSCTGCSMPYHQQAVDDVNKAWRVSRQVVCARRPRFCRVFADEHTVALLTLQLAASQHPAAPPAAATAPSTAQPAAAAPSRTQLAAAAGATDNADGHPLSAGDGNLLNAAAAAAATNTAQVPEPLIGGWDAAAAGCESGTPPTGPQIAAAVPAATQSATPATAAPAVAAAAAGAGYMFQVVLPHPSSGHADFVILQSRFLEAVNKTWQTGDRVQVGDSCAMANAWVRCQNDMFVGEMVASWCHRPLDGMPKVNGGPRQLRARSC